MSKPEIPDFMPDEPTQSPAIQAALERAQSRLRPNPIRFIEIGLRLQSTLIWLSLLALLAWIFR